MRYSIFIMLVVLGWVCLGQSKKEQIEILSNRLDSLENHLQTERNQCFKRIDELNQKISQKEIEKSNLIKELLIKDSFVTNYQKEKSYLLNQLKIKSDSLLISTANSYDSILYNNLINSLLGTYQSDLSCDIIMPRFTDKHGPKYEITIYALNEYRNDIYGSHDSVFYVKFNYCGDSGQNAEEYSSEGFGEIINFNKQNNLILLTIETSKCSEFNSYRHDEVQQEYRSTPNQFYLQIEILPKNKLKINSFNSPKICPLCWDLRNVIFSPLKWSR